ncbi:TadE/TadG family type IV pilus assembly protein [Sulfitobacter sp. DSM 110093]|uniref:TadE/TadG family type IV pilus assembly protein n=1 Tax=Sulfitobacter sp. DSM 110093 TaxID=2883127 RepID=UPI001FACF374|nr:TadE/TadG family type IV pilus assembly protein [Sulfitobacter sp. DSM 110093]
MEFALILPLLLAILLGIACFGQYFSIAHSLQQLAAETARYSVRGLGREEREDKAYVFIEEAKTRFPILQGDNVTELISMDVTPGPGIKVTLTYDLTGSVIDLVDGFLGLKITKVSRSSHLVY